MTGSEITPHLALRRVERQQAEIDYLAARTPRPVTAARLAESLGIGVRTVERDLTALRAAGLPVEVTRGPGGGYRLDAPARCHLELDLSELGALFASLVTTGPWSSPAAVRALTKLQTALTTGTAKRQG